MRLFTYKIMSGGIMEKVFGCEESEDWEQCLRSVNWADGYVCESYSIWYQYPTYKLTLGRVRMWA